MSTLARQNIEVFARYLYEIEGCPQGRAREHWLRAERQLSENLFQVDRSAPARVKVKFERARFSEFMELSH
jgi:hypothetical protein